MGRDPQTDRHLMLRITFLIMALTLPVGCTPPAPAQPPVNTWPTPPVSASEYLTPETRAQQEDPFENPAYLWVDRGEALFSEGEQACSTCHTPSERPLNTSAATHPQVDAATRTLLNLEGRINQCRTKHQSRPALDYESEDLLSLTSYIASLSKGEAISVQIQGAAAKHFDAGRTQYFQRQGQLNLSCSNCHDDNWGKKLRGDTISQGHPNAFPAYRLEWQTLGSLHRRFQDCNTGVRAQPHELGSSPYLELELYLAARAAGLEMESPAIRR